ncbi:MAG TPA: hypothetical protein PKH79_08505 [Prolixibacteraceae bacterium]|nr:hypothetical protein [Prolixibacteraceae bacterium]
MKLLRILGFLLVLSVQTKADVIYSPFTSVGMALSLEGIGSYEIQTNENSTINFWGGFGAVSVVNELFHPAVGCEIALELRHYFQKNKFDGFNLGLYSGLALMRYPYFYRSHVSGHDTSVGFVPGLKLTYKNNVNSWLVAEPYIGISTPWYGDNFSKIFDHEPGLILTIGLRMGYNRVLKIKSK